MLLKSTTLVLVSSRAFLLCLDDWVKAINRILVTYACAVWARTDVKRIFGGFNFSKNRDGKPGVGILSSCTELLYE